MMLLAVKLLLRIIVVMLLLLLLLLLMVTTTTTTVGAAVTMTTTAVAVMLVILGLAPRLVVGRVGGRVVAPGGAGLRLHGRRDARQVGLPQVGAVVAARRGCLPLHVILEKERKGLLDRHSQNK